MGCWPGGNCAKPVKAELFLKGPPTTLWVQLSKKGGNSVFPMKLPGVKCCCLTRSFLNPVPRLPLALGQQGLGWRGVPNWTAECTPALSDR